MNRLKRWLGSLPVRGKLMLLASFASGVALLVYAVGLGASFWLPEPPRDRLPD